MAERIVSVSIVGTVGIIFIVLGYLIWKKEKITLFNDYHVDKISDEDKKAFCRLSGIGILVSGAGLLITAIILAITDSALSFIVFAVGFVIGIVMLIMAEIKYNHKK